ncbi:MAG: hypothetical protein ACLQU4_14560 [Limisphaerales bacterium]
METDWAVKNLQVIRTLMERGAVYRRALAPVMGAVGLTGVVAGVLAAALKVRTAGAFAGFWMAVAFLCVAEAFWFIRRQALKDSEPFWSPPTRRVAQAVSPPFFAGFAAGLIFLSIGPGGALAIWLLVPGWMVLYGCALHAAGFFMPRGFKLFGWAFIGVGCLLGAALCLGSPPSAAGVNWAMGALFGGPHLAYGVYLYFTEKDGNAT